MSDNSLQNLGYKQELKRELGFWGVVLFGIAMMFPLAPVVVFGEVSSVSHGHMALAYLIAVIPMSFTAFSYGQMAGAFPIAGSAYSYTQRAINPHLGFFAGWAILLDYALFPILNYIVIGFFTTMLFGMPDWAFWVVVPVAVALVTIVNLLGIKSLSRINNLLVAFMFVAVIYFIIASFTNLTVTTGAGLSSIAFFNGSEFSFSLLLNEVDGIEDEEIQYENLDGRLTGKKALLVDDVPINRIIVISMLESTGIAIDEAGDGTEALKLFMEQPENTYDIIYMDVQLPEMNGYDAAQAIRKLDRADAKVVPIIALTANAFKEDIDKAIASGMNAHLAKPLDLEKTMNVTRKFLGI